MMRRLLVLLTGGLMWAGCAHVNMYNDRTENQLRGEVRSCREYYNNLPGNAADADTARFYDHELFFDRDGRLSRQVLFATKAVPASITAYSYTGSRRLDSTFSDNGTFAFLSVNDLNKDGYITKTSSYDAMNNNTFSTAYTYDGKNHLTEKIEYSPSGRQITREVYTLDTAGRKVQRQLFTSANKLESYDIYHYNVKGDNTATNYYSPDGVLVTKYSYEYDSLNNMTLNRFYNTGHDTTISARTAYVYDKHQNWTEKAHYADGKKVGVTKRELVYY